MQHTLRNNFVLIAAAFTLLLAFIFVNQSTRRPLVEVRSVPSPAPSPIAVLSEASEMASGKPRGWSRILRDIAKAQMRAKDWSGAWVSIRSMTRSDSDMFIEFAESLARDGKWTQAQDALNEYGTSHGWSQKHVDDRVQLKWVDYLIENRELDRTYHAAKDLTLNQSRADSYRKLAVAYKGSGDIAQMARVFSLSIEAALAMDNERERAHDHFGTRPLRNSWRVPLRQRK